VNNRNNIARLRPLCLAALLIVFKGVSAFAAGEDQPQIYSAASSAKYLPVSSNWDGAAAVNLLNSFIDRGQVKSDEPVCQPQLEISRYNFYADFWGNLGLTKRQTGGSDFSEFDVTLGYKAPVKAFELRVGLIDYLYPNTTNSETREVFFAFSYPNPVLTPRVQYFYDFDEVNGSYLFLALEHQFAFLNQKATLTPGVSSGWGSAPYNKYNFKVKEDAFDDGNVYASFEYKLTDTLQVGFSAFYMWLWNGNIRNNAEKMYFDNKHFVFGVNLLYDL